ncbi:NAD(P)/FAD-dependent oxidoreductase [Streptomyces albus]|uniref:NAD(P)/FAD-dependent oxidoreductase n=2 Tax=Streptomyces albus TaxID=1888 RepID=A0A8H1QSX4_9ACTN|nr:FAD-dependent oxidoreductase [Streptomyces albus]TGG81340.1 NAD(P)/FAD-dependent oxidoreductase [Streptomyces albus]
MRHGRVTKATNEPAAATRILVVGGGYVGMYTALRLQRRLRRRLGGAARLAHAPQPGEALAPGVTITVLDPDPYMTYQPFLPEAAAGSISPRHVVVPLRRVLPHCQIVVGEARSIDHERRVAHVSTLATAEADAARAAQAGPGRRVEPQTVELPYTELVLAPGSVSRTLPVPGLAEHGIGFKTVEEAIGLRNHVLEQLDIASSTRDPAVRDAALTFVFVGGGYAGVEALAELEDMARHACRSYHNVAAEDLRFLLVEASDRILPEVGEEMGGYALRELRARNIDVRLGTRLDSCENRIAALSDGSRHPTRTLVWTAGVKPHPLLARTGLPLTSRGRLRCDAALRVEGVPHAWAAGDAAAVPDLSAVPDPSAAEAGTETAVETGPQRGLETGPERSPVSGPETGPERGPGKGRGTGRRATAAQASSGGAELPLCAPNAQHAVRQARRLADNLVAVLDGREPTPYRHAHAGSVASLGLHKGVAHVYGRKLKGYPAWFMHRAYHLSRVPTFNRKARVLAEWVLSGLFEREIVSLGSLEHPRAEFELAAGGVPRPDKD